VPYLLDLVKYTRTKRSIRHIALSTNGSASTLDYLLLNAAGVNDFSISLDSCCAATADKIADKKIDLDIISKNIKTLSSITHVTVGIVCTEDNVSELNKTIEYAHNLGVSDIRIIPSAQWNNRLRPTIDKRIIKAHPILKYRMNNIKRNIPFRGIDSLDCHRCPLVLDDIAVVGADHYPCIIYLREHGMPMGIITGKTIEEIRHERLIWYETHNSFLDPICKKNCLDVCKMYNLMASRRYPHEK
jgi:MoaA/NifB/PqqE/SkfB family radical SAM enzyme